MSSTVPPTESSTSRRRRPKSAGPKPSAEEQVPEVVSTEPTSEKTRKPRPPRVETVPVPDDAVGKTFVGRISDVVRKGVPSPRPAFGFINLGSNIEPIESVPRIYFRRADYQDVKHYIPRRGYEVEFIVNKNEEGRFFATSVHLTEQGKVEADVNKAKADEAKAARLAAEATTAAATPAEAKTPVKSADKKPRKPRVDTIVQLLVSVDGIAESQLIDVKVGRPLFTLKREVLKQFEVDGNYEIMHVPPERPEGIRLTAAILKKLVQGDKLHFSKDISQPPGPA